MESDLAAKLGTRFEVRAMHVGERIDVRGVEPRLSPVLPCIIECAPSGYAVLLRGGAVVLFGVDPISQERFIKDLGARIQEPYEKHETERAYVRTGEADALEPDAIIIKEVTVERLQVIAEVLAKSVILQRHEQEIDEAFRSIEPTAQKMRDEPGRLPWKQADMVEQIGKALIAEHQLVGTSEISEKPDLLWDKPDLDRFYARLEDEYEIRERHLIVERKLTVVSSTARTMLELSQTKRSLNVEYYIVALILLEIVLSIYEMIHRAG